MTDKWLWIGAGSCVGLGLLAYMAASRKGGYNVGVLIGFLLWAALYSGGYMIGKGQGKKQLEAEGMRPRP